MRTPLKVYLIDARGNERFSAQDRSFDQRNWVKGEESPVTTIFTISNQLEPGTYGVRIGLTDAAGKPSVRLPIAGEEGQLRYQLGTVRILPVRGKR